MGESEDARSDAPKGTLEERLCRPAKELTALLREYAERLTHIEHELGEVRVQLARGHRH